MPNPDFWGVVMSLLLSNSKMVIKGMRKMIKRYECIV